MFRIPRQVQARKEPAQEPVEAPDWVEGSMLEHRAELRTEMASEQLRNNVIVCLSFTSAPLSVDPNAPQPAWCASALKGLSDEADTCFASTAGAVQPLRPALEAGWSLDSGCEVLGLGVPGQGSSGQMPSPSSTGCRADRQATVHRSCLSCSVDVGGQRPGCLQCGHGSFRVPSEAICGLWFMCSSSPRA